MKKLVPLLVIIVAVGGYYYTQGPQTSTPPSASSVPSTTSSGGGDKPASFASNSLSTQNSAALNSGANIPQEEQEIAIRPLTEAYTSADDALAAVLKGSKDYDDSILEQFNLPDENCSWCPEFYSSVRGLITDPQTPQEQRSYLAEILAISGRTENVQSLIDAIKGAPSNEAADLYAEALELALGKDDITTLLGEQMNASNDTLREASVAALTNQGTRLAAELLVKDLKEKGDPDTYYSQGIGPGEFIPDEDALPVFQELVRERGVGAAIGVKALLNAGLPGVRMVFDELENSSSVDADAALLRGAEDHVNIEDGLLELTKGVIDRNRNPNAVQFAKRVEQLVQSADEPEDEGEEPEQLQTLAE